MSCRHAERLLSDRMNRPLTLKDERALESHLADCRHCRGRAESFAALAEAAGSLRDSVPTASIAARAFRRFRLEPVRARIHPRTLRWAAGAVNVAILAIVVLVTRSRPDSPHHDTHARPSPSVARVPSDSAKPAGRESPVVRPALREAFDRARVPMRRGKKAGVIAKTSPVHPAPSRIDDLSYVNSELTASFARFIRPDQLTRLEREFQRMAGKGDDFVKIPYPRIASTGRRAIAAALAEYQRETAVIDARLARKVTVGLKAISFSDLCRRLKDLTNIDISAGRAVADDKITVFCHEKPLRDLMRQISGLFGFHWRRAGEPNNYSYELTQDLKSQLLEEELRNRDRNEALLALDKELEQYRKYAGMSPEDIRKAAESAATPEEKRMLENLAKGWGAAQLYFNLSPDQMASLRNGDYLQFSSAPMPGMNPLPPGMERGIYDSMADVRVRVEGSGIAIGPSAEVPGGVPPGDAPGTFAQAGLQLDRSELGQFTMAGMSGVGVNKEPGMRARQNVKVPLAVGVSPSVQNPRNAESNQKLGSEPALRVRTSIVPIPSADLKHDPNRPGRTPDNAAPEPVGARATSSDVLEAIHKATGGDVIGDFFTRLHAPESVTARNTVLFVGLNKVCDAMRVRWTREAGWLQFRSAGFFNDRLKEIPNRLLEDWAATRREQKRLGAMELAAISQLSDAQLDAETNAQGARAIYGLEEWELARSANLRAHWRFFAGLPESAQRRALTNAGLSFGELSPSILQRFLSTVLSGRNTTEIELDQLPKASLRLVCDTPAAALRADDPANKSAVQFTYSYPDRSGAEWTWSIEPFRTQVNSRSDREEKVRR